MEVRIAPHLEAQLARLAAERGRLGGTLGAREIALSGSPFLAIDHARKESKSPEFCPAPEMALAYAA